MNSCFFVYLELTKDELIAIMQVLQDNVTFILGIILFSPWVQGIC